MLAFTSCEWKVSHLLIQEFITSRLCYLYNNIGRQEEGGPPLQLPILDGSFICKAHRRKGWGIKMMEDITQHFPNQDIGLSQPISHSLELGSHIHYSKEFSIVIIFYWNSCWNISIEKRTASRSPLVRWELWRRRRPTQSLAIKR